MIRVKVLRLRRKVKRLEAQVEAARRKNQRLKGGKNAAH